MSERVLTDWSQEYGVRVMRLRVMIQFHQQYGVEWYPYL